MTTEYVSFTFDLKDRLLSFQTGFSSARATLACSALVQPENLIQTSPKTPKKIFFFKA